ncbi:MAG: oligosaccharide flippase family protein [Planctomycetota bacterium]|jgi:O-antigen/teichoic acid export membrane protein
MSGSEPTNGTPLANASPAAGGTLRQRTMKSLFWQLLGVGGQRAVVLVQPIVLARSGWITPTDVAAFVVVTVGIGIVEALTTFVGEQTTIVSERGTDRRYLDTVFTVRLLRALGVCAVLCALSWPLGDFFASPESATYWLPGMFLCLSFTGLLDALQSPARAVAMKSLDFRRLVVADFTAALLATATTIALAAQGLAAWSLVIGHMANPLLRSLLGYWAAPHRPRFCLDRGAVKELLHYNLGAAGAPFVLLMVFSAPAMVFHKLVGDDRTLGQYEFASKLARLPEDVFLRVVGAVAVPAYAQLRQDRARLTEAWLQAVQAFLVLGGALTIAMAWCGDTLPLLLFSEQYGVVPGLFALLCAHGGVAGLCAVVGPLLWAVGKPSIDRNAQTLRCLIVYGAGIPAALHWGALGFAAATILGITAALLWSCWAVIDYLGLPLRRLLTVLVRGSGLAFALLLGLLAVDLAFAPTGTARLLVAMSGGALAIAKPALRLLRQRRARN